MYDFRFMMIYSVKFFELVSIDVLIRSWFIISSGDNRFRVKMNFHQIGGESCHGWRHSYISPIMHCKPTTQIQRRGTFRTTWKFSSIPGQRNTGILRNVVAKRTKKLSHVL